jgi:APA family basic amino acid/polyamine antiporter
MSRDGLLPAVVSRIHPRFKTPYLTTIITGVVVAIAAGLFPISVLGELVSIGTLLAFVIVCVGVLVLRRTNPEIQRPFRAPFMPWVPILGALTCFYLMAGLPLVTWERLAVWLAIGFVIYFFFGRRNAAKTRAEKAANLAAGAR